MQIVCSTCGAAILAEVNIETHTARCVACNSVFDISGHANIAVIAPGRRRPPIPLPKAITLAEGGKPLAVTSMPYRTPDRVAVGVQEFELVRRWFSIIHIFFALFLIVWDWTILTFALNMGLRVFLLPHTWVGIIFSYITLAGLLNRTTVAVTNGALSINHGPLPWPGNRTIPTGELQQLYCKEVAQKASRGVPRFTYSVLAELENGETLTLLSKLPDSNQALFIEQTIETHLGIDDAPVWGELQA